MGDTLKVLGQANILASVLTDLYTVPALMQTTISSITICNTGLPTTTFSISIAIGGAIDDLKQYIYYGLPLDGGDTFIATIGITLAAGDVLRVFATTNLVSFNLFGVEVPV